MDEFARAQLTEALDAYREYMHTAPGEKWDEAGVSIDYMIVLVGILGEALVTIGDEVGDLTYTYGKEN